jgi:hypothetical protein
VGAIVALALALAGCGDGERAAPRATATAAPATGIDFRWTGTIVGRDDRLHIEPDGTVTLQSRGGRPRPLDVPQRVIDNVLEDLAAADLGSLEGEYGGPSTSDGQVQKVSAGGVTVSSENGGGPPQLGAVLADLTDIVANAEYLVRFRIGIRTSIGPDLATMEVTRDGIASVHTPNTGNTTAQLSPAEIETITAALDRTPFEQRGTPGFVASRAPLDEGQVVIAYRWLTLQDPPKSADPAIRILSGLI